MLAYRSWLSVFQPAVTTVPTPIIISLAFFLFKIISIVEYIEFDPNTEIMVIQVDWEDFLRLGKNI